MRLLPLIPCLLLAIACGATESTAPADLETPLFSASGEHRAAIWIEHEAGGVLFNGQGDIEWMPCSRGHFLFTNNPDNHVIATTKCSTTNTTGRAVRFTYDDNPLGIPIAVGFRDPDGNAFLLYDWYENISASGQVNFRMWGTPDYP
jgi:hypothetical protein